MGILIAGFFVLIACVPSMVGSAPALDEATSELGLDRVFISERCGDPAQLSDALHIYHWSDYIDERIITLFEEECSVDVTMDLYASNEEAIAKIQAGNSGYDLLVPSDYAVKILIDERLIQKLKMDIIPNVTNLDPASTGMYYDPENAYSLPYAWSTTGVAYNVGTFPDVPTSFAALLSCGYSENQGFAYPNSQGVDAGFRTEQSINVEKGCEHSGFVSMLDEQRETIGMALQYLGHGLNSTDPAHHAQALELLQAQKDCISGYDSENVIQTLAAEEVVVASTWSFAAALAYLENEDIRYFIPEEGGIIWQDNMVIPSDAPHPYTAHIFINYLLDPEIGAMLNEWTFSFTPNAASAPLLSEDYVTTMETVGLMVDDEIRERLEWVLIGEGAELFADTWESLKAR
ncbi:MAG: spermidine/putrescine ABC transporter substrate-binding protein [Chloroflexota bacterium]